jgi:hypothetical protein
MRSRLAVKVGDLCFFPLARGLYWVSSMGRHYYTDSENGSCTCIGWQCSKEDPKMCKHLKAIKLRK